MEEEIRTNLFGEVRVIRKKMKSEVKKMEKPVQEEKEYDISFSLTQSLLQKAVRRNRGDIAAKALKEMLIQNENKTLRRFLIVILEDAILHPNYGKIGTLYRNGVGIKRRLTDEEKDMLIQTAFEVGNVPVRDIWVDEEKGYDEHPEQLEAKKNRTENSILLEGFEYEIAKEILEAIRYRASAGGMYGDQIMMWNYYYLWLHRFVNHIWSTDRVEELYLHSDNTKNWYEITGKLTKPDVLPEAADFHCTPQLKILMRKEYVNQLLDWYNPELAGEEYQKREDALGDILWRQHSSLNLKTEIDTGKIRNWYEKGSGKMVDKEKEDEIYAKTRDDVYGIANWFINKATKL